MKKLKVLLLIGMIILGGVFMFGCLRDKKGGEDVTVDKSNPEWVKAATCISFNYEHKAGDEFELNARIEDIDENGGTLELKKRVGPMNYNGRSKEGELSIPREKIDELLEILSRYDIKGYSELPTRGSVSTPIRSLYVIIGEDVTYVAWNAKFPETIPPTEDIMYYEIFNFFNDIVSAEPGWEEVRSDNLDDPRDNPAYGERIVEQYGNEVSLVPGTAALSSDGTGAEIDYGDKLWWQEEGFIGEWQMTAEDSENTNTSCKSAGFTVDENGNIRFTVDGIDWTGTLGNTRYYRSDINVSLTDGTDTRTFTIAPMSYENYDNIQVSAYPGPVPEEQFAHIFAQLTKTK